MVVVAKFGGGCGKDGPSLEKVVDIIISDKAILEHKNGDASGGRQRRVITISAPGDDGRGKITDLLKNAGKKFLDTGTIDSVLIGKVWERYEGIADYLGLDQGFLAPYKQMMIDAIGQRSSKYKLLNKMINMKNAAMDMFRYGRNAEVPKKKYLDFRIPKNPGITIISSVSCSFLSRKFEIFAYDSDSSCALPKLLSVTIPISSGR